MRKLFLTVLFTLCAVLFLFPVCAFSETELPPLSKCELADGTMQLELPNGWYFNTPKDIDDDFLDVSENSARKLKKYLSKQKVKYNLVSKDLKQEINVILIHDSKTKLLFNYNEMDSSKLESQARALVNDGSQESKAGISTFSEFSIDKVNDCTFVRLKGDMSDEYQDALVTQYSTVVNGYGINISIKCYDTDLYEQSEMLIAEIISSFTVDEILPANFKGAVFSQVIFPALLILLFIGTTIFLFIRQLRKNKKEEREQAAAKAKERNERNESDTYEDCE